MRLKNLASLIAIAATILCLSGAAQAGPCTAKIKQFEKAVREFEVRPRPRAGIAPID